MPNHLKRVYPSDVPVPRDYESASGKSALGEHRMIVERLRAMGYATAQYQMGVTPAAWFYIGIMRALNDLESLKRRNENSR